MCSFTGDKCCELLVTYLLVWCSFIVLWRCFMELFICLCSIHACLLVVRLSAWIRLSFWRVEIVFCGMYCFHHLILNLLFIVYFRHASPVPRYSRRIVDINTCPSQKDILWNDCPFVGIIISLIMLKWLRQGLITSYVKLGQIKKRKMGSKWWRGRGVGFRAYLITVDKKEPRRGKSDVLERI